MKLQKANEILRWEKMEILVKSGLGDLNIL